MLHQIYLRGKIKSEERKEIIKEDSLRQISDYFRMTSFCSRAFYQKLWILKLPYKLNLLRRIFLSRMIIVVYGDLSLLSGPHLTTRWKKFRITFGLSGFLGLELYHDDLTKLLKVFADVRVAGLPRDAEDDEVASHFFTWNKNILTHSLESMCCHTSYYFDWLFMFS